MVYQIFGLPLGSEVDNDTFYRHVHPEDRERVRATVRASVESQSAHALDYRIVRPEGQQRWVTQRAEVVNDEQVGGRVLVGVVQDVTELRQTEQDLRTLQAALEQRVAERTAELVAAYGQLESFSYSVSHDLRAPLRHIAGYVALLEEEVRPVLNKQVRAYVQSIQSAVERMSELIDALLEFCRLHRAELVWEGVEHAALVQELRCELDVLEGGRRIHWDITELPASQGDARLLRSVWQNLLSNAIKYSARVEQPLISVTAVADEDYLRFSVRDNGVGFDLRYAGKLFRVFERLHSAAEFPGTGVGLAVVRRIVERHGGRVWAESAPGEGACFFFTLPRTSGALATDQTVSASQ
jgi:PAS domain S-box-containing protein